MSQVIAVFWTRDSVCPWVYRPKKPSAAPKCWGGLWELHQGFETNMENFSFLRFCSPRTKKCDFKVNVAFLNPYWDPCKTSLCKLCVKLYMYDGDFLELHKSWTKRQGCFQGKHPSTSSQDTLLCSSFTFQPAARRGQSTQISLGHILLFFIKDQIWLFSKYGLPTYLKNINWVKIASGFCEESGSLRNLIVHSRQSHMNHVEKGTKISVLQRGEIVQFCCSSHVLFNPNHQTVTPPWR